MKAEYERLQKENDAFWVDKAFNYATQINNGITAWIPFTNGREVKDAPRVTSKTVHNYNNRGQVTSSQNTLYEY